VFSRNLGDPALVGRALVAFVLFCLLTGALYLLNDLMDYERDRAHPRKRSRPVASGALPRSVAAVVGAGLLAGALIAAFALSLAFGWTALAYAALLAGYSLGLKHVAILDVLVVAAGFVLRAAAGGVAIDVEISPWLIICTLLLALFLVCGKRRHEILALEGNAPEHRPSLVQYTPQLLDQMISIVTASTVMAYALYTLSAETAEKLGTRWLPLTIPFVLYGIFRYLYLLYRRELGGNPSELFLTDGPLLVNCALWALAVILLVYGSS